MNRYGVGAIVGGIFGFAAAVNALRQGETIGLAFGVLVMGGLMGMGFVMWIMEKFDGGEGDMGGQSPQQDIAKLQRQLNNTIQCAAAADAQGDPLRAGQFRSQAAVIESQLRSLGA